MDTVGNVARQFGVYWPNLIAQIILFAIVYYVLKKFAFQAVISMLEERRRRIEEGQLNAEKIKRQLAEAQTKYEEVLAKANADSQRLLEEVAILRWEVPFMREMLSRKLPESRAQLN